PLQCLPPSSETRIFFIASRLLPRLPRPPPSRSRPGPPRSKMVSADRQTIIETNRSLRNIKTELENLLEKGVIDEAVFENIHAALPQESPLSGPLRTAPSSNTGNTGNTGNTNAPPTRAFQNLGVNSSSPAPPSYDATPAPNVPSRNVKPVVAHARALYRYAASDARDVSFEKDDKIAIHEYMNQDWWMGQNLRTGQEGIFPRSYVLVEPDHQRSSPPQAHPQAQYGYPSKQGPPPQQNPYNANVPPVAVAEGGQPAQEQQGGGGKAGEFGKKIGKNLGNAAVFGAGATIGSNLVNSIF
ncbi:SH3 domain-containing protein, partial [Tolypocladium capitatum]